MGFFSWRCAKTNRSIPAWPYAGFERTDSEITLVTRHGNYTGVYDGYGRIDEVDIFAVLAFDLTDGSCRERDYIFNEHRGVVFADGESNFTIDKRENNIRLSEEDIVSHSANGLSQQLLGMTLDEICEKFGAKLTETTFSRAMNNVKIVLTKEYKGETFAELPTSEDCEYQGFFYDWGFLEDEEEEQLWIAHMLENWGDDIALGWIFLPDPLA